MAKKICPIHGIYNIGEDYTPCPRCKANRNKIYDKNNRDKEMNKFYHSKIWKQTRALQLSIEPLCVMCGKLADTVDHIKAIKNGGDKLHFDNLQSMCKVCHNIKEFQEGNRFLK